jgi:hypothetical protein
MSGHDPGVLPILLFPVHPSSQPASYSNKIVWQLSGVGVGVGAAVVVVVVVVVGVGAAVVVVVVVVVGAPQFTHEAFAAADAASEDVSLQTTLTLAFVGPLTLSAGTVAAVYVAVVPV